MSFNLFDLAHPRHESDEPAEIDVPLSVAQKVAKTYMDGVEDAIQAVGKLEAIKGKAYGPLFDPFSEMARKIPCVNQLQRDVHRAILSGAKQSGLAAPGEYHIESDDFDQYLTGLNRHGGIHSDSNVKTDILGLCEAIEAKYGGVQGQKAELKRAAKNIVNQFDLTKTEIEVKSGMVELRMRMWLSKNYRGKYEWEYGEKNRLTALLRDLSIGLEASGMSLHFTELTNHITVYPCLVEPGRTSFDGAIAAGELGNQPVRLKVQKEHLRWRFSKACADTISDFVSQYGSD